MAIDTAEKRQNLVGVGRPYLRSHYPIGTPDAEWRASVGLSYGGNFVDISEGLAVVPIITNYMRNKRITTPIYWR